MKQWYSKYCRSRIKEGWSISCSTNLAQTWFKFNSFPRNTPIGANNSVPDSCCHEVREGCGNDILRQQVSDVRNKIFVDGCITILKVREHK